VRAIRTTLIAAGHTRVVVVSGRAIADLGALLALDPLPELWGSHGWERQLADGAYRPPALGALPVAGLQTAHEAAAARGLEQALERKPAGLALHWRGLAPEAIQGLREEIGQVWASIVLQYGLKVHQFDGGLELRVPGQDKGSAVRTLLAELQPGAAIAYLGDDLTDEDAFHAIGGRGLRVLVRPEQRPSAADVWLRPPEELLAFLRRWARSAPAGA
jgi:trehalose-phosphatase